MLTASQNTHLYDVLLEQAIYYLGCNSELINHQKFTDAF